MANKGAASSSSAQEPKRSYDVFLSFRGEDTRFTFTGNLYSASQEKGINTFIDDKELKIGNQLSPSLLKAIEESRISIIVLSENYASSTWCLEELSKILECMEENNQLVWPIFYKVKPSDIRHQRNRYGEAMAAHEDRFKEETEKVFKWRSALSQVAKLKGWEWHPETRYEYELIHEIVKAVATKFHREHLYMGEHVIGHQACIAEVKSLLEFECSNTCCMLGIHGTGGIGKTTLAKSLYNSIIDAFECAAFLESVRERSNGYNNMLQLQHQLLSQLLQHKEIKLGSVDEGANTIKTTLCYKKVLLVIDDVDKLEQLEKLAGGCDWFGSGSRIIITTKDKHLLNAHNVEKSYEMKLLNGHEALQLFSWSAFKTSQPARTYEEVSIRAMRYANGLPLALKVIGSNFIKRSVEECECALKQYKRIPTREIQDILKVSYDCLEDNVKDIFLHIACFFRGDKLEYVEKIVAACDLFPEYNIGVLVDKSLLTIEYGFLKMHDLIKDMGREIVRQEAPSRPGYRSRLCFHEDVIRVLTENSGSSNIEGIMLDPPEEEEIEWSGTAFKKMKNLRILIIRKTQFSVAPKYLPNSLKLLEWTHYPSQSLPEGFSPRNIAVLNLRHSSLLQLEKPLQKCKHLAYLNLSGCKFITHVPDMSGVACLRELKLYGCDNLIKIHESVGFLKQLVALDASDCPGLRSFLPKMWLPSLTSLSLKNCQRLEHLPEILGEMKNIWFLNFEGSGIKALPQSISNLIGLEGLGLNRCRNLRDIPFSFFMLPNITDLYLVETKSCQIRDSFRNFQSSDLAATSSSNLRVLRFQRGGLSDEDLHVIFKCFPKLEILHIEGNDFVTLLPACIKESVSLRILYLDRCMKLQEIPELPSCVEAVYAQDCPLNSDTTSMLWSQVRKEVNGLEIVMRETEIPDWFDYRCEGNMMSFWSRQKFPAFAVAFVFKKGQNLRGMFHVHLYVNGVYIRCLSPFSPSVKWKIITLGHVIVYDVGSLLRDKGLVIHDKFLEHHWNFVVVKGVMWDLYDKCSWPGVAASECGAYVYRKETNMDDLRFQHPPIHLGKDKLKMLNHLVSICMGNTKKRKREEEEAD